jgi:type VI protein secretion system component Hcp
MTISGIPGQIAFHVDQTDWSQIQGMPDPSTSLATGSSSLLSSKPGSPLTSRGGTSGARSGRLETQDISVTKDVDQASPNLMLACETGRVLPSVTLEIRTTGGDSREYLVIKMTNVVIASIAPQSATRTNRQTESVTFAFEKLNWDYRPAGGVRSATPSR